VNEKREGWGEGDRGGAKKVVPAYASEPGAKGLKTD